MVDVGDPVDEPHDRALERLGSAAPVCVRIPSQTSCVRFRSARDPERLLVVTEAPPEAALHCGVEGVLARVPERRVAHVVTEADRLDEVLVQPQRAGDDA